MSFEVGQKVILRTGRRWAAGEDESVQTVENITPTGKVRVTGYVGLFTDGSHSAPGRFSGTAFINPVTQDALDRIELYKLKNLVQRELVRVERAMQHPQFKASVSDLRNALHHIRRLAPETPALEKEMKAK